MHAFWLSSWQVICLDEIASVCSLTSFLWWIDHALWVGDSTITPASEVKNLGIWFDQQFKDTHVNVAAFKRLLQTHFIA